MMLRDGKLVFLDFGLGRHSDLFEDKAVDLLVLKKSLQSIDGTTASKYFDNVLEGYAESYGKNKDKIIEKIKEIESRGRYKVQVVPTLFLYMWEPLFFSVLDVGLTQISKSVCIKLIKKFRCL